MLVDEELSWVASTPKDALIRFTCSWGHPDWYQYRDGVLESKYHSCPECDEPGELAGYLLPMPAPQASPMNMPTRYCAKARPISEALRSS